MTRGDDDETPPQALLTPILSWMAFALFQTAVATGIAGLISHGSTLLTGASVAGFAGWVAMTANVARALSKGRANLDA
jgi:hypothetical protein